MMHCYKLTYSLLTQHYPCLSYAAIATDTEDAETVIRDENF
jgi:hypothetical protein